MVQTQFFCSTRDGDIGLILLLLIKGRFKNEHISVGSSPTRKALVQKVIVKSRHPHLLYLVTKYVIGTISSSLANHKQLIVAFTLTENESFVLFVVFVSFFVYLFGQKCFYQAGGHSPY